MPSDYWWCIFFRFRNYLIGDLTICSTISCPIFIWNAVLKWMMCLVWLCLLSNCFSFILIEIMRFSGWLCYEQMQRFFFLSYFVSSLCVCVCASLVHLYFTNLSYNQAIIHLNIYTGNTLVSSLYWVFHFFLGTKLFVESCNMY